MRVRFTMAGVLLGVLAVATGAATAAPAHSFHTGVSCQAISSTLTICFEAWGIDKLTDSASGNRIIVSNAHRRFTEFTNGTLTFEQRDKSHHVLVVKDGRAHIENSMFVGTSTPSGLFCRWREHLVVRDSVVLHSVDDFSCSAI